MSKKIFSYLFIYLIPHLFLVLPYFTTREAYDLLDPIFIVGVVFISRDMQDKGPIFKEQINIFLQSL